MIAHLAKRLAHFDNLAQLHRRLEETTKRRRVGDLYVAASSPLIFDDKLHHRGRSWLVDHLQLAHDIEATFKVSLHTDWITFTGTQPFGVNGGHVGVARY